MSGVVFSPLGQLTLAKEIMARLLSIMEDKFAGQIARLQCGSTLAAAPHEVDKVLQSTVLHR